MKHSIVMPKAGLTNTEGVVAGWNLQDGAPLKKGDVIGEIENEKSTIELLSPTEGYLVITSEVGEEYKVGETIGYVVDSLDEVEAAKRGEDAAASAENQAQSQAAEAPANAEVQVAASGEKAPVQQSGARVKISPYAKKLAQEAGLDYAGLTGTGPANSIVSTDVLKAIEEKKASGTVTPAGEAQTAPTQAPQVAEMPTRVAASTDEYDEVPASTMRKSIARNMKQSQNDAATAFLSAEFDVTELFSYKKQLDSMEEVLGNKVTLNELLSYVVVKLAVKHPYLNSQLTQDNVIRTYKNVNFSFAVANDKGLVTPVVRKADQMSLNKFSLAMKEAVRKGKENALTTEDLTGGTVTVSNLGMYPADAFMPIINPPQTAIFGLGRAVEKPVVKDGEIVVRRMMWISCSFDHRNLDGAAMGEVFQTLKSLLENPNLLNVL